MNGRLDFISRIDFSVFPIMVMSCWPALVRKCHAPPCCLLFFKKYLFNASYNKQNFLIAGPFQKFLWSPNWLPRGLPDSWTYMLPLTDSQVGNLTPRFSKTDSLVGDLTPSGARVLQRFIGPCHLDVKFYSVFFVGWLAEPHQVWLVGLRLMVSGSLNLWSKRTKPGLVLRRVR